MASVFKAGLFAGKTAIVTGGATGIGQAVTRELLYLGANVVIASRKVEKLQETATQLNAELPSSATNKVITQQCDVRDEAAVDSLFVNTLKTFSRLDLLFNNGGGQFISPADKISPRGWAAVVDTNLTGTFLLCRAAYNHWMGENGGTIVNMGMNNLGGSPFMAHSGAARAGVENLTKTLATEWAPAGIRINCIIPGIIYSPTAAANYPSDVFSTYCTAIPAQRTGTLEEVSAAVVFLLSPGARYVSGVSLAVDGAVALARPLYPTIPHDKWPRWGDSPVVLANQKSKI